MKLNNKIWGILLKALLVLILGLSILQVIIMKFGWDPLRKDELISINDTIIVDLDHLVVNELQTNGRLYVRKDSNLIIKYHIMKNKIQIEDAIDWSNCFVLNSADTLYPKSNCTIVLRATLRDGNDNTHSLNMIDFNMYDFIKTLITENKNKRIFNELFAYSWNQPLTICYDGIVEDVCERPIDKGLINSLRNNLKDNYHIDSIEFYSNGDSTMNILSNQYPIIKFIGCKRANGKKKELVDNEN